MKPWKILDAGSDFRGALMVAAFVVSSLGIASLSAFVAAEGIIEIGLRWSISPGKPVFFISVLLLVYAFLRHRTIRWYSATAFTCLVASTLSEYAAGTRLQWIFFGVSLCILSEALAFHCSKSALLWRWAQWVLGTYVHSVFLYNLLNQKETMTFFSGGIVT